jgi:hypothetical protein
VGSTENPEREVAMGLKSILQKLCEDLPFCRLTQDLDKGHKGIFGPSLRKRLAGR